MVRIPAFHCHGPGSISGWGIKKPNGTAKNKEINRKAINYALIFFFFFFSNKVEDLEGWGRLLTVM